jgi:hypothetical protein
MKTAELRNHGDLWDRKSGMRTATTWLIYKSNIEERLNAFFHARTSQRLSLSAINMDELDAVTPILIDYIGLRRLNASVCLLTRRLLRKTPQSPGLRLFRWTVPKRFGTSGSLNLRNC